MNFSHSPPLLAATIGTACVLAAPTFAQTNGHRSPSPMSLPSRLAVRLTCWRG